MENKHNCSMKCLGEVELCSSSAAEPESRRGDPEARVNYVFKMAFLKLASFFILSRGNDNFKWFVLQRWLLFPPR